MEAKQLTLYAQVLRGLIHYHERMILPLSQQIQVGQCTGSCPGIETQGTGECPAVTFANNVYHEALKEALRLMEKELERL